MNLERNTLSARLHATGRRATQNVQYWCEQFTQEDDERFRISQSSRVLQEVARRELRPDVFKLVNELGRGKKEAIHVLLASCFVWVFSRYTGRRNFMLGTHDFQVADKPTEMPVVVRIDTTSSFREFTISFREKYLEALDHSEFSMPALLGKLGLGTANDLYAVQFGNIRFNETRTVSSTQAPLLLLADITANSIHLVSPYSDTLNIDPERFLNHFEHVASQVMSDPAKTYSAVQLMSKDEIDDLLEFSHGPRRSFDTQHILQAWRACIDKYPEKIAVVNNGIGITYQELDTWSDQVAHYLNHDHQLKEGDVIAILCDRSARQICGMLTALKLGSIFVTIDSQLPVTRILHILNDAAARLVICCDEANVPGWEGSQWTMCERHALPATEHRGIAPNWDATKSAYVIYTSGTTGVPKGTFISHAAFMNMINDQRLQLDVREHDRVLQFASASFDASVFETFLAVLTGASLVQVSMEVIADPRRFVEYITENGITFTLLPPAYLSQLDKQLLRGVKTICVGGDYPVLQDVHTLRSLGVKCFNLYGPSETAVIVSAHKLEPSDADPLPIGQPISNTSFYILDAERQLLPAHITGELYIGGKDLASGYHNRPELTRERFIRNPFGDGYLYRTGDRGYWTTNGQVVLQGRIDDQVKIRGYRIEPQEVRHQLNALAGVLDSCVVVEKETGGPVLRAFYTTLSDQQSGSLAELLSPHLPAYMIPASFMRVDSIPMTHAGKVDRKKLLEQWHRVQHEAAAHVALPQSPTEIDIHDVWYTVLGKSVGIDDPFLRSGGDSIKAIQMASRLTAKGYRVNVRDIFIHPTIRELSGSIKRVAEPSMEEIITGEIPLSPLQRWFLQANHPEPWHFNQTALVKLAEPIDKAVLSEILTTLINHHDALRIVFVHDGEQFVQRNLPPISSVEIQAFDLTVEQQSMDRLREMITRHQRSFRLDVFPLLRADYYRIADDYFLALTIHHLIIDVVSWSVLLHDLDNMIRTRPLCTAADLPSKTTSWGAWCRKMLDYVPASAPIVISPDKQIPREIEKGENKVQHTAAVTFTLDETLTRALDQEIHLYRTTVQDFLLAALAQSVFQYWSNMKCVAVEVETHGRTLLPDVDVSNTVGWFTAFYPVLIERADVTGNDHTIIAVKENVRKMQALALDYSATCLRDTSCLRPSIVFNYMGTIGNARFQSFSWSDIPVEGTLSPLMNRIHDWEINALIADGRLVVSFTYGDQYFSRDTMEHVANLMQEKLTCLVTEATTQQRPLVTPSDLVINEISLDDLIVFQSRHDIDDVFPLTPMQEGMFFHAMVDRKAGFYNTQLGYQLIGKLNVAALEQAFSKLLERHAGLRSCFLQDKKGRPWQLIRRCVKTSFTTSDLSGMSPAEADDRITKLKQKDRDRGFDLAEDVLMRIHVVRLGDDRYYFLWSYHHIVMDGWCMSVLMSDWMKLYAAVTQQNVNPLPVARPYRSYMQWRRALDLEAGYSYWAQLLQDYPGTPDVPRTRLLPSLIDRSKRAERKLVFESSRSAAIKAIAEKFNVTLNVLVQGVWGIILGKYLNSQDVVFGTVVSGRPSDLPGVESIVGLLINTVPVRVSLAPEQMFSSLLDDLQQQSLASAHHQYGSLAEIQSRMPGSKSLVNHIMLFENFPSAKELGGAIEDHTTSELSIIDADTFDTNNYSFTLVVVPAECIQLRISFNPDEHADQVVEDILVFFDSLFDRLEKGGDQLVKTLRLLPDQHQQDLLRNGHVSSLMEEPVVIPAMFDRIVSMYGDREALVSLEASYTYTALHKKSNRIARLLCERYDVSKGNVVAVHMERSARGILAIWSVLKCGAVYVPIDPSWPAERKRYILQDAGVQVVISLFDHFQDLHEFGHKVVAIDIQEDDDSLSAEDIDAGVTPDDIAYIIYTSGSTGLPKGVRVRHGGNVNMALDQIHQFKITADDHILQFAPLFFDASVYEWSIAAYAGACLCIPEARTLKSPVLFNDYLQKHRIDMVTLPPAYFATLSVTETAWPRIVVQAGSAPDAVKTLEVGAMVECYNAYGPTECSVCIAVHRVLPSTHHYITLPIGKPVSGNTIYLLDEHLELVPFGSEGEICVAGANLSAGYVGCVNGEKEVFTANPFTPHTMLYRTGDMARWLPGYELEFAGRKDRQLKVRGYRIEPGEVEAAIRKSVPVTHAVVTSEADHSGIGSLVAYLAPAGQWNTKKIMQDLRQHLPEYMIPHRFEEVVEVPVTASGKIDYQALSRSVLRKSIVPAAQMPANAIQEKLYAIWKGVLGKDDFGINDKYFEIGGNSLSLIRVHAQIKELCPEISVADIFNYNTIEEMATYIHSLQRTATQSIAAGMRINLTTETDNLISEASEQPFHFSALEWENVLKVFQSISPGCSDEHLLLSFYCFVLYEVTGNPTVRVIGLDKTGTRFRGITEVDFTRIDTRESLLAYVVSSGEAQSQDEPSTMSDVQLNAAENEIVAAFSYSEVPAANVPEWSGIDILLKAETSRNGDLRMTLLWRQGKVSLAFLAAVRNNLMNVVRNLTTV